MENRRGKNDKVSRRTCKIVETEAGKARMVKVKREREKGRRNEKVRKEEIKERET